MGTPSYWGVVEEKFKVTWKWRQASWMIFPILFANFLSLNVADFLFLLHAFSSLAVIFFKGTVRRDARWVENGLKRCVLTNNITASHLFFILKRHHHEKSLKPVSASKQQLHWLCRLNWQNPANDGLRTFNSIDFLQVTSYKLRASIYELRASSFKLRVTSCKFFF